MAFKLDPGGWLKASQKAKGWQQQSLGNASPMSFSSGLVADKGSQIGPWDIMDEQPKIITPEIGVFSNDATDTILGGQIDAYGRQANTMLNALDWQGEVHRSNEKYKFVKELAEQRKKAAEKKKSGGGGFGGFLSGALSGASAGATFGPWGAVAGGVLGGASSLFG
jgi:hypothetical protein